MHNTIMLFLALNVTTCYVRVCPRAKRNMIGPGKIQLKGQHIKIPPAKHDVTPTKYNVPIFFTKIIFIFLDEAVISIYN